MSLDGGIDVKGLQYWVFEDGTKLYYSRPQHLSRASGRLAIRRFPYPQAIVRFFVGAVE